MYPVNIRLGHACNSSSSHSIIVLHPNAQVRPHSPADEYYGWEDFTLVDTQSKREYMTSLIADIMSQASVERAEDIARDITGLDADVPLRSIDHQSLRYHRITPQTDANVAEFARLFYVPMIDDSRIVVLGGNDNSNGHPDSSAGKEVEMPAVARKDTSGAWTFFDVASGNKVRVMPDKTPYRGYSDTPELVDLKITDFCDIGCAYCYQGSTRKGKHAKHDWIIDVTRALSQIGVLEIAMGGGEPTQYPTFSGLLEDMHLACTGMVNLNMTTRRNEAARALNLTSYALSVDRAEDIPDNLRYGASVQYVVGAHHDDGARIAAIIDRLKVVSRYGQPKLTLLGFKPTGRGAQYLSSQNDDWINALMSRGEVSVAIDTQLAKQYQVLLHLCHVDHRLYETEEGAHSCYIDAVTKRLGVSSYGDYYVQLPEHITADAITSAYHDVQRMAGIRP